MAESHDYIIIGAGSAGSVLADALSTRHSVLVLEAGGSDRSLKVAIPAAFSKNFKTRRDWDFSTEPDDLAGGRRLYVPRGRVLGGSSSINAMIYIRGRPSDYARWEVDGAHGWGWDDVLPAFVEMEANSRFRNAFHGQQGAVRVEDLRTVSPYSRAFVEASVVTGIRPNIDFNGPSQEGAGFFQHTQNRGRRWSAADAFLRTAMTRPTLTVLTGAHVTRLVVSRNRVLGVEYEKGSERRVVYANGEVILAAGAIGSPHILQLSGIGPADHLRRLGIEVTFDNRHVGEHLHDHPVVGVVCESSQGGTLDDAETVGELIRWLVTRRGRLTSPVAEAGAFVKSSEKLAEPDLELHFGPVFFANHGLEPHAGHAYSLGPMLMHPRTQGSVMARSSHATRPPAIVGNHLRHPDDVAALVSGLRISRRILAAAPFDKYRSFEILPGEDAQSDDQLREFVYSRYELLYHPVGTCRIGPPGTGVVTPDLRLHGLDGVRVVDASVMPSTISGNTNAATMMIAYRASKMILG